MNNYAFVYSPSLVHHFSIDTPYKLWTMYGVSMEYVWSIFGGSGESAYFPLKYQPFILEE